MCLSACGGGAPLLHPAHVLPPGAVTIGGGLSGQLALRPLSQSTSAPASAPGSTATPNTQGPLQEIGIAPGVAPWVSGRMGMAGDNDFGITYAGRALRLDGRHAFAIGQRAALSLGLGASAILARRPEDGGAVSGVYGGGADIPLLIGWRSTSDIYSVWFGPRGGFEIMGGSLQLGTGLDRVVYDASARHFYGMLVAGLRVGFRHVHVSIELDAAYHRLDGTFKTEAGVKTSTNVQQLSLTPAGALQISF